MHPDADPLFHAPSRSWPRLLSVISLAATLALSGCGSSGKDGAAGSDAPVNNTETGTTSNPVIALTDSSPGVVLTITGVTGQSGTGADGAYFKVGDKPTVTFTLKKANGAAWHLNEMTDTAILVSGPTKNYQRVIPIQADLISRAVAQGDGTYTYTFAGGIPSTFYQPYNNTGAASDADGQMQGEPLLPDTYTIGMATTWHYTVNGVAHTDTGTAVKDVIIGASGFTNHTTAPRQVVMNENCAQCHVEIQNHEGKYKDPALCVLCHTSGAKDPGGSSIDFRVLVHRIHNGAHLPSVLGVTSATDGTRVYGGPSVDNTFVDVDDNDQQVVHDFTDVNFPVFPSFQSAMPKHAGYSALSSTGSPSPKTAQGSILQGVVACYKCHGSYDGNPAHKPIHGDNCYNAPTRRACGSCHDDITWTNPYSNNGKIMPAQTVDGQCTRCHAAKGDSSVSWAIQSANGATTPSSGYVATGTDLIEPATNLAHAHPIADPRAIPEVLDVTYDANQPLNRNNGLNFNITGISGNAASYFASGEKPAITFTITDNDGADVPLYSLQAINTALTGPTNNRQLVFPLAGPKSVTVPVCDFSGRLVSTSATGKGIMSRVVGSSASETLKVQFTSATAFTVTGGGSAMTALGGSALPASPSTNASGTSVSAVELTSAASVQTITVNFTSATDFTVTGSVDGAMGGGTMPATTNASTRFTSSINNAGSVAFTISSGATTFAAGNNIYMTVFTTSANNHKFAIVAGRTSFAAGDRFFYETVSNSLTSYTYNLPMDLVFEYLGDGVTGAAGETFTAANLPVFWGRETVYERTAMAGAGQGNSTLAAASAARDRYIDLASATNFAANDYVVIDEGVAGLEEYIQIGSISGVRATFKLPLRYAHALGAACKEVTLTQRLESTNYTLNPATGTITTVTAVTATNAIVVSYRTNGAFGWKRAPGDSLQAVYQPPPNDSADLAQAWGEWNGLAYQNGSYTAQVWGSKPIYITRNNETQAYQLASNSASKDFAYGAAATPTAYNLISSQANCEACHDQVTFHGGSRKGNDTCVVCHGLAGMEDWPAYAGGTPAATTGVTTNFRTMLHKIHMGADLTYASSYTVVGNSGSYTTGSYAEVEFPVMPGGVKACDKCHGADNVAWKEPAIRAHAAQTTPTLNWKVVCSSCHDSPGHAAHMDLMTTTGGAESCVTCHGEGKALAVDKAHQNR